MDRRSFFRKLLAALVAVPLVGRLVNAGEVRLPAGKRAVLVDVPNDILLNRWSTTTLWGRDGEPVKKLTSGTLVVGRAGCTLEALSHLSHARLSPGWVRKSGSYSISFDGKTLKYGLVDERLV